MNATAPPLPVPPETAPHSASPSPTSSLSVRGFAGAVRLRRPAHSETSGLVTLTNRGAATPRLARTARSSYVRACSDEISFTPFTRSSRVSRAPTALVAYLNTTRRTAPADALAREGSEQSEAKPSDGGDRACATPTFTDSWRARTGPDATRGSRRPRRVRSHRRRSRQPRRHSVGTAIVRHYLTLQSSATISTLNQAPLSQPSIKRHYLNLQSGTSTLYRTRGRDGARRSRAVGPTERAAFSSTFFPWVAAGATGG
jgi:hypothetical protein